MMTRRMMAGLGAGAVMAGMVMAGAPACAASGDVSFAAGPASPVAFEFFRNQRIVLPVEVNGQPVDALLDSGAGIVTLDKAFAARIGVKPDSAMSIKGAANSVQAGIANGVTIKVGGLTLKNVRVAIIDLSQVAAGLGRPLPLVLGRDAFEAAIVDIDFPGRRIAFHNPAAFSKPAGAVRLPLTETSEKVREVPASVEGAAPGPATFDLGSGSPLSISLDYAKAHGLLTDRPKGQALAGGVGGLTVHDMATVRSVRLGTVELKDVPATINRSPTELPATGLNLGMPLLSRFRLIIDYGHDELLLVPNAQAVAAPFRKDRAGLGTMFASDRLRVMFVSPGSPAEKAGWKVGEQIKAIDGEVVSPGYYAGPHAAWQSGPRGHSVELTLDDGSKRRLILDDYF
jgi:hypothetical protein